MNIVVFGESGAGKSSLINLIAGQQLAHSSSGILGTTFEHKSYPIDVRGVKCYLWDTMGLGEGTEGRISATKAQSDLKKLLRKLAREGGINLVIYCTRAGRVTKSLKGNYNMVYSKTCQKKAPIALVVTGLEYQRPDMEAWWRKQKDTLEQHGMHFDEHACVTTLSKDHLQERRSASERCLHDLIVNYSKHPPWRVEERAESSGLVGFLKRMPFRLGRR